MKILYLANKAPTSEEPAEEDSVAEYHHSIYEIIKNQGFRVTSARDIDPLLNLNTTYDYVFSLLNRAPYKGSEILPSALCEYHDIPYLGADPYVRATADDKHLMKIVARELGIASPASVTYKADGPHSPPSFPGPYFLKPRSGATSRGLTESCIQDSWDEIRTPLQDTLNDHREMIIEQFIPGKNISQPVISGSSGIQVLNPYQLISDKKGGLVTYKQKRRTESGLRRRLVTDSSIAEAAADTAHRIASYFQEIDYFRLDFRASDDRLELLEMNICCNVASRSGFMFSARSAGYSHEGLLVEILRNSFARQQIQWNPF